MGSLITFNFVLGYPIPIGGSIGCISSKIWAGNQKPKGYLLPYTIYTQYRGWW